MKNIDSVITLARNKKAFYEYEILDKLEAGIVLRGTEVKSCKSGKISIKESYAKVIDFEVYLINMYIKEFEMGSIFNHTPRRSRKLLLHRDTILKIDQKLKKNKGLTLVPLSVYQKKHLIKISLGLAKGKRDYEKRQVIKERETKIEMAKAMKKFNQ